MKKIVLLLSITLMTAASFAGSKPDYSIWDRLLKANVSSSGKVDYKGFKAKEDTLDKFIMELRTHGPATDWSRNDKKAYYINGYNAYTVKFVLRKYPLKSVKDASFSGKDIWSVKLVKLGDKTYTLGQVENDILRRMNDPRIHFAINCASYSCPRLLNAAFTADNVSSKMTGLTKKYINDPKHNIITPKKVKLSKIFDWYKEDFVKEGQTIIDYINKYSQVKVDADAKIEYLPYNWSLNE